MAFHRVKKYMLDNAYTHTDEWLKACMDWIQSTFGNVPDAVYQKHVYEQWIDANLEELGSSCLPANLSGQKCCNLGGKYGLQMNSIQDIGESAYNQWKKIRQLENENINVTGAAANTDNQWAPKPKRCLYLTLSDGIQLVYGLELTPISCLSLNLRPGVKILFMGPIECRRGVLQLRPVNVKVIGGEVEGMFDSHSMEAVLSSRLNIPRDNIDSAPPTTQRPNVPTQNIEDATFPDTMDDDDDQFFMEIDENLLLASDDPPNTRALANSSMQTQLIDIADANTEIIDTQDFRNMSTTQSNDSNTRQNRSNAVTSSFPSTSLNSTIKPPPVSIKASINGSTATRTTNNVPDSNARSSSLVKMLGGFQTAKNVTNSSKKPKAKQLKIDGYMKPMPVVIKPATPPVKPTLAVRKVVTEIQPLTQAETDESSIILITDEDEDGDMMGVIEDDFVVAEMDTDEENALGRRENTTTTTRRASRFVPPIASTPISTSKSRSTGIVHPTIVSTPVRYPIMVPSRPYIYIKQIKENLEHWINTGIKSVKVKACVATLISNIRVENGVWTLSVSLNDGTGFLNCILSPELLNRIIGFDPAEMKRLKSMKTQTAREKIAQGMKELTEQLVLLNAIVEIELCSPDPIILNFTDVSILHINAIKYRISTLK